MSGMGALRYRLAIKQSNATNDAMRAALAAMAAEAAGLSMLMAMV